MATGKKKVIVYTDWISTFNPLTDEEAGRLIKHFFSYVNDLNPESDRLTELLFNPIKQTLKRDLEAWEKQQERNKENGQRGGRPKKPNETEQNQNNPVGFSETETNPKKGVSDSVSVSVNNNTILPTSTKSAIDFDFEKFLIFFNQTLGKNHKKINDTIKAKIKARLKEGYTKHDFQKAVENIAKEKYHIETQFRHATPEFISRADKLEMYIGKSDVNNERVYVEPRICDY
jgi:uncharacterized phage protein (TIGR02220 family)